MNARNPWDTEKPEEMVILARERVDTVREGNEIMPKLRADIQGFLDVFDGVVDAAPQATHFWSEKDQNYVCDVYCMVTTKGGWHE